MLPAVGAIPGVGSLGGLTSTVKSVTSGAGVSGAGVSESAGANSPLPSEGQSSELEPTSSLQGGAGETAGVELEPSLGGEAGTGAGSSGEGGFGEALTNAISSLEQTQQNATSASQALATGSTSDPESAVATVAEAQLAMQLASQIRTKATEAVQNVFQTQV